jgi:hypothetical protein
MDEGQIKHMANRFLAWKLPEDFHPDNGISFKPTFNDHMEPPMRHDPVGTNLLNANQAEAMVRYMIEGLPARPTASLGEDGELVNYLRGWQRKQENERGDMLYKGYADKELQRLIDRIESTSAVLSRSEG